MTGVPQQADPTSPGVGSTAVQAPRRAVPGVHDYDDRTDVDVRPATRGTIHRARQNEQVT
jgi:hypothetical protein